MKRSSLCKLFSAVAAAVLCITAAGFSVSANVKTEDKDTSNVLKAKKVVLGGGETVYYVDGPSPETDKDNGTKLETRGYNSLSAADQAFFDRCKGLSYGYDDLSHYDLQANAARSLYKGMYEYGLELWNKTGDLEYTIQEFDVDDGSGHTSKKEIKCLKVLEPSSHISGMNASQVYFTFRNDNPLFYFYGMSVINYENGDLGIIIEDDRYIKEANRASYQNTIKSFLSDSEKLVKNDYSCTDYRNALELYKKVMNNMEYAFSSPGIASDEPFAHNILGGIIEHSGVCESYARIYRLLLNYNNIENIFVTGNSRGESHAWNLVKFDDGKYYYADPTWDDQNGSLNGDDTDFFALGENNFLKDHTPDGSSYIYAITHNNIYLNPLPPVPAKDFDKKGDYRKTNPRLVDFNKDGAANNKDIKFLQSQLTAGTAYVQFFDMNSDNKLNNRDLKELQSTVSAFAN